MFKAFLGKFVVAYLDDILVSSKIEEELFEHLKQVVEILEQEKIYSNLKKCTFFSLEVVFLSYLASARGIQVDQSKVEAIQSWPIPSSKHDAQSFHGLAYFYMRFIRNFSTITTPMIEVLKGTEFVWTSQAERSFEEFKEKLTHAPILALSCFDKVFSVECDASRVGIGEILIQESKPFAYFSEKLRDARRKYSTYDKEFFAIVRPLNIGLST